MKSKFFFSVFQGQTLNFLIRNTYCSPYAKIVDYLKTYLLGICVGSENVFKGLFTQTTPKSTVFNFLPFIKLDRTTPNFPLLP